MNKVNELINKNRKVFIGLAILAVLLVLLAAVSVISRFRDQSKTSTSQTTDQTSTQETIAIYSTTPSNNETNVPIDADVVITFTKNIVAEDLSFKYDSSLKFKISQETTTTISLKNQGDFQPNKRYQIEIIANKKDVVFQETNTNKYAFSFTTGKETLGNLIRKSVGEETK